MSLKIEGNCNGDHEHEGCRPENGTLQMLVTGPGKARLEWTTWQHNYRSSMVPKVQWGNGGHDGCCCLQPYRQQILGSCFATAKNLMWSCRMLGYFVSLDYHSFINGLCWHPEKMECRALSNYGQSGLFCD
jgi:hypothetical protein